MVIICTLFSSYNYLSFTQYIVVEMHICMPDKAMLNMYAMGLFY